MITNDPFPLLDAAPVAVLDLTYKPPFVFAGATNKVVIDMNQVAQRTRVSTPKTPVK